MSSRQALIPAVLRLYSSRPMREWRSLVTAPMLPFWPQAARESVRASQPGQGLPERWTHRRFEGDLVIENGGGRVFSGLKRHAEADALQAGEPRAPADLSALLPGGRFIPREPALVLYAGAEASLARFCDTLVPRFFALDRFGLPENTLLMVGLRMGRTRPFQDAISDGLFRPRPVELFRPATAIRVKQLDDIAIPLDAPEALAPLRAKIAALYGPFASQDAPVLVLERSAQRLAEARAAFERLSPGSSFDALRVLDPALQPFNRLVKAVAAAPVLVAPRSSGEAAVSGLVPSAERKTVLLDL